MKPILFISLLLLVISNDIYALPTAKITIKVVDEHNNPVKGSNAGLVLESGKRAGNGWGTNTNWIPGITDARGLFAGEGATAPYVSLSAKKEGYYDVSGVFKDFTDTKGILGFRKYEPWNPTVTLVLKKIKNPIPMYAVNMSGGIPGEYPELPLLGKFVGYDLSSNDWVEPHGKGQYSDFLFKVDVHRAVSIMDHDVTLTLKFSNIGDGLIAYTPNKKYGKSALRFPYHAPTSGYSDELIQHYKRIPNLTITGKPGHPPYDTNYFFRVRTKFNNYGKVSGGLYGKIHGTISLGNSAWLHKEKAYLSVNYYLNPSNNDTNIEFNIKKNLFSDVIERKQVRFP